MASIFPKNGVPPAQANCAYDPVNTSPDCPPRYYSADCNQRLDIDALNALKSELVALKDIICEQPWDCTKLTNLADALPECLTSCPFHFLPTREALGANEIIPSADFIQQAQAGTGGTEVVPFAADFSPFIPSCAAPENITHAMVVADATSNANSTVIAGDYANAGQSVAIMGSAFAAAQTGTPSLLPSAIQTTTSLIHDKDRNSVMGFVELSATQTANGQAIFTYYDQHGAAALGAGFFVLGFVECEQC